MGYMKFSIFSKDLKTAKMPNILKTKLQAATTWVNFRKFWLLVTLGPPATAVYERCCQFGWVSLFIQAQ